MGRYFTDHFGKLVGLCARDIYCCKVDGLSKFTFEASVFRIVYASLWYCFLQNVIHWGVLVREPAPTRRSEYTKTLHGRHSWLAIYSFKVRFAIRPRGLSLSITNVCMSVTAELSHPQPWKPARELRFVIQKNMHLAALKVVICRGNHMPSKLHSFTAMAFVKNDGKLSEKKRSTELTREGLVAEFFGVLQKHKLLIPK